MGDILCAHPFVVSRTFNTTPTKRLQHCHISAVSDSKYADRSRVRR